MATSPSHVAFKPYTITQLNVLLVQDYESVALASTGYRRHWDDFDSTVSDGAAIPWCGNLLTPRFQVAST